MARSAFAGQLAEILLSARADVILTTIDDIRAAASRLDGRVLRTPLRHSPWLSADAGAEVFLKLETLQPTLLLQDPRRHQRRSRGWPRRRGTVGRPLVTASAGNHGRALALAAREAGIALTVYVACGCAADQARRDPRRRRGAAVRARDYDEAEVRAKAHGASGTPLYISPYSHPDVIAGAGTVGLEILEDQPDDRHDRGPDRRRRPDQRHRDAARALSDAAVLGVEVEASSPFTQASRPAASCASRSDRPSPTASSGNLDPDTVTFDIVRTLVVAHCRSSARTTCRRRSSVFARRSG